MLLYLEYNLTASSLNYSCSNLILYVASGKLIFLRIQYRHVASDEFKDLWLLFNVICCVCRPVFSVYGCCK